MKVLDAKDYDLAYIICSGQKQPLEVFYKSTVRNIHWKTPVLESLFLKKKKISTQVFSCGIFRNTCFKEYPRMATSEWEGVSIYLILNLRLHFKVLGLGVFRTEDCCILVLTCVIYALVACKIREIL